ncbi:hypothetical protein AVEN_263063-1 [Araneus ventricosus]|uniref:Uncharacterized protein n=1 Tax=Araneus ventricosus TaxID=182803 RepID=A0A4Y2W1W2_ARAVE|nr:hypothetical protein AVEN_263063-1 [Araneus ventricosus]
MRLQYRAKVAPPDDVIIRRYSSCGSASPSGEEKHFYLRAAASCISKRDVPLLNRRHILPPINRGLVQEQYLCLLSG